VAHHARKGLALLLYYSLVDRERIIGFASQAVPLGNDTHDPAERSHSMAQRTRIGPGWPV
jgi:hypothetical protein